MSSSLPLGNSLNNPGNIRTSGIAYKGEVQPSANPSFKQFQDMSYGFRAMASLLYNYINSKGLNTIRKIINTYAPAADNNNPDSYANFVASQTGIGIDDTLSTADFTSFLFTPNILKIIRAMARIEQGQSADDTASSTGYTLFLQDQGLS